MNDQREDAYTGWRFLYSKRWLGYYAMLLIFAVGCVLLSNWQMDRREQARAEISRIVNNYDAPARPLEEVLTADAAFDPDKMKWQKVVMTGRYIGDPILVRNRPGNNGTGSNLVQAFETQTGTVLFVDRGWTETVLTGDNTVNFASEPLAANNTQLDLTVRLRASEPQVAGRTSTAESVGSINTHDMAQVAHVDERQYFKNAYGMLVSETPSQPHGVLPQKPELDEGPHLSYALQWIVFIGIAGVGVWYAARQEFKNFNRGSKQVERMEQRAAAKQAKRAARRGKSDADIEDELLDSEA